MAWCTMREMATIVTIPMAPYLSEHRFLDPAPEPEALVQDPLPGMEAG